MLRLTTKIMKVIKRNQETISIFGALWIWSMSGRFIRGIVGEAPGDFSFLLPKLAIVFNRLVSQNSISVWQRNLVIICSELFFFVFFLYCATSTIYYLLSILRITKTLKIATDYKIEVFYKITQRFIKSLVPLFGLETAVLLFNFYALSGFDTAGYPLWR